MSIAGLILASGESRRFGRANKLLAELGGQTVVRRTVLPYLAAGLRPVAVVLGYQSVAVAGALEGLDLELVPNPDFAEGQSAGLRRGVAALGDVAAAVIGVADQPFLTAEVIRALVDAYRESGACIVAPRYAAGRGNPVLFDRSLFPELMHVQGDVGGRVVIARHQNDVIWRDVADERAGLDIDTLETYRGLRESLDR